MKIIGLPGSLRSDSSSRKLLIALGNLLPAQYDFEVLELIGKLPHFDEKQGDTNVEQFRKALINAEVVVICTPEYAFGIPGSLKNAIDWTVGTGELVNKKVLLITASSYGHHGHAAMRLVLEAVSAKVIGELLIPAVRSKIIDGVLTEETIKELRVLAEKISV